MPAEQPKPSLSNIITERQATIATLTEILDCVGGALYRLGVPDPGHMTLIQVTEVSAGDKMIRGLWRAWTAARTLLTTLEQAETEGPA